MNLSAYWTHCVSSGHVPTRQGSASCTSAEPLWGPWTCARCGTLLKTWEGVK